MIMTCDTHRKHPAGTNMMKSIKNSKPFVNEVEFFFERFAGNPVQSDKFQATTTIISHIFSEVFVIIGFHEVKRGQSKKMRTLWNSFDWLRLYPGTVQLEITLFCYILWSERNISFCGLSEHIKLYTKSPCPHIILLLYINIIISFNVSSLICMIFQFLFD